MKHIPPSAEESNPIAMVDFFEALRMMEDDHTVLVLPGHGDDFFSSRTEDNREFLKEEARSRIEDFTLLAAFEKVKGDLNLSVYAQLCVDLLLHVIGDASLLALDLQNAVNKGIIDGGEISVSDLKRLYPNGFYNSESRYKRLEQYRQKASL